MEMSLLIQATRAINRFCSVTVLSKRNNKGCLPAVQ